MSNRDGHCFKVGHGSYTGARCPCCAEVSRALGDGSFADAKRMYCEPADVSLAEAYYPDGRPAGIDLVDDRATYTGDHMEAPVIDPKKRAFIDGHKFLENVWDEVVKARAKFPGNGSLVTGLALGEEAGEAQRALLHIHEGKSAEQPLYEECVQTAAMALRLALESEDRTEWLGNVRKRTRDEIAAQDEALRASVPYPRFARRAD